MLLLFAVAILLHHYRYETTTTRSIRAQREHGQARPGVDRSPDSSPPSAVSVAPRAERPETKTSSNVFEIQLGLGGISN